MNTKPSLLTDQDVSSLGVHLSLLLQTHLLAILHARTLLEYLDYEDSLENSLVEDFNDTVIDFSLYMNTISVEEFSKNRRKLLQLWKHIKNQSNDLPKKVKSMCTILKMGLKSPEKEMVDYIHQRIIQTLSTFDDECQTIGKIIKKY